MTEDDWLIAATADAAVVAEILIKLRLSTLPLQSKHRRPAPPQSWTIHQRRSKTQPVFTASNKSKSPTASPTTPLSWSCAPSASAGSDAQIADVVDSIKPSYNHSDISRSKVTPPHETTKKRPKKKKTLAALKKEEVVLMDEQYHLKRKLAVLQANREKQIKENERLRKIKLDRQVELHGERPESIRNNYFEVVDERNDKIVLPDLNVPFGEDMVVSC